MAPANDIKPAHSAQACRHRRSWLIAGSVSVIEWCYQCGAVRHMSMSTTNVLAAATPWARPSGPDGDNPFEHYQRACVAYDKRRATRKAGR